MVRDKKASEFKAGSCLPHQVPGRVNYTICPVSIEGGRVNWRGELNGVQIEMGRGLKTS